MSTKRQLLFAEKVKKKFMGNRFGLLRVLGSIYFSNTRRWKWKCLCDCGRETWVFSYNLTSGHTKSCGCLNLRNPNNIDTRPKIRGESTKTYLINIYKRNAKKRSMVFNLTRDEAIKLFTGDCYYCGYKPSQMINKKGYNGYFIFNGIDRINPQIGYELPNCVPCCKKCNSMKGVLFEIDFISHIKKILKHKGSTI